MDAIIFGEVFRDVLEKKRNLWKKKALDLQQAFDRVQRKVLWWALRVMKVDE